VSVIRHLHILFLLLLGFTPLTSKADILVQEYFNSGALPAGWTSSAIQGAQAWTIRNAPAFSSSSGTFYAVFDDALMGPATIPNESDLTTSVFNCTNRTAVYMNIQHHWYGVEDTHGFIEVSNDGGTTWNQVIDYEKTTKGSLAAPQDTTYNISTWAANQATVQVRFRYTDGGLAGQFWYLDDLTIYSDPDVGVTDLVLPGYLGCASSYTATESVTVEITNHGFNNVSNIPVTCQVTGGTTATLTGTYAGTITPGATANLILTGTVNMSADAIYNFSIYTQLATDEYLNNDTLLTSRQQVIFTYPYIQDFNGTMAGWNADGSAPPLNGGRNFNHGNLTYLNGPEGEGDSWYVETTASNNSTFIWVESPIFNFSGLTEPQLFVDLKHSLHNSDYFQVQYSLDGGTTWTQLGTGTDPSWYNTASWWRNSFSSPIDSWTTHQHSLCALAGQSCVKLRFYGRPYYSAPTYSNYHLFAFDNVEIRDGADVGLYAYVDPTNTGCLYATNQQVTVQVYNFGCTPISNVPVQCDVSGTATTTLTGTVPGPIGAGTSVNYTFPGTFDMTNTGTYNFMSFTSLPGDIYIDNDSLALSINVNQLKVTTYPYTEDFNSGAAYWIAGGSNPPLNDGRNFVLGALPYLGGPLGQGDSWYVETTSSNSGTYIWAESPVFDFSNVTNPVLTMDIQHSLHSSDYFNVQYSIDGGTTWAQLGTGTDPNWYNSASWWRNSWSTPVVTWTNVEQELCNLSGEPCVKFRVYGRPYYSAPTYSNYHLFAFDNFSISAGEPDDIRPVQINLADAGDCAPFSNTETISAVIQNNTCRPLFNVPIDIQIDGGGVISEVMPGPIPRFGYYIYTFTATADLSAPGTHTISVTTNLATDGTPANDNLVETRFSAAAINGFPYTEDFNSGNGGWVSRTTNDTRLFVLDTLPYLNGPEGEGSSWHVRTSASNNSSYIWVESPEFDFTGLSDPQLYVDIKHSLHNSDYFRVEYSINGGTTWTQLGSSADPFWYNTASWWRNSFAAPVDSWTKHQKSLCALAGETCVKFRFYGRPYYSEPTYSNYHLFAFDNIEIRDGPDVGVTAYIDPVDVGCLFATNQQVTIQVYNFGCNPISNVPVQCDVTGLATSTLTGTVPGPIPAGGSVNYTFPGTFAMTGIGTYNFMSYTLLPGDININNDSLGVTINVNQLKVTTYPYVEDFNSGAAYWIPGGANPPANDGRNFVLGALPYLGGPLGQGDSWYVETTSSNSGTYIWAESPVFDLTNVTNPVLSMDIQHSLHNSDYFNVQYSIDGGGTWAQLGAGPDPTWYNSASWWRNSWSTPVATWTNVQQELCTLSGEACVKFRIYGRPYYSAPTYANYHLFAFDNFSISAGDPDDIRPVQVNLADAGDCAAFSNAEVISVVVENLSCRPLYNVPVDIQIDGGGIISEIMPGPIPRFGYYIYTFTTTADLSTPGTHTISVTTNLASDGTPGNDILVETRYSAAPISAFPYSEDFNSGNAGWVSRTTNNTRLFVLDTIPYLNGQQGEGDSWHVMTSASNNSSYIWVESPEFDFSSMTEPQLYVDLKHSLHNSDYFRVEYSLNGGTTWTQLGTGTDPNWYNTASWWRNSFASPIDSWTNHHHSLCALAGQSCVKLRFYGRPYYSSPTYSNYHLFAFDNVEIRDGADVGVISFIEPVDNGCLFSANQNVTVEVFNFGCAPIANVPVQVDVNGILNTVLTGTVPGPIAPGTSVNYTFGTTIDMTPIGNYTFDGFTLFPADINNTNDSSQTSVNVNQVTISTFPYFEDFNSGPGYWLAGGSAPPANGGRNFVLGTVPYLNGSEGHGDQWYVETTASNNGTFIWAESPVFDFSAITNPKLLFEIKHSLHNSDYFRVEYTTNGGTTWTQLGSSADPYWYNTASWWRNSWTAPVDSWTIVEMPLCTLAGEACVKFRIYGRPYYSAPTYSNYHLFAFDNFHITNTPIDAELIYVDGCYGSEYNLDVTVFNNNRLCQTSATINSIDISYEIDGGAITTQTFTGLNIPFGATDIISIPGVTIPGAGSTVTAWCKNPNGVFDQIFENDTARGYSVNWPNCNDYCSNAITLGLGTTTVSQTSNASTTPDVEPPFPCGSPTLENTVWYTFTTDASGGDVTVTFQNTVCTPSTNGIQVSINEITGPPCDTANYNNVFCANNGNILDVVWGPVSLPPNTTYYITVDGYAGNDCDFEIAITGAVGALPVEFGGLTANCTNKEVVVSWSTLSETNNDYFEIQKSIDGFDYEVIGSVEGQGNSISSHYYIFRDQQPLSGIVYYRLKQVDNNGDFHYTDWAPTKCDEREITAVLFPNPSIGADAMLNINAHVGDQVNIQILTTDGKLVGSFIKTLRENLASISLNQFDLEKSVYQITIQIGDRRIHKKWIVH